MCLARGNPRPPCHSRGGIPAPRPCHSGKAVPAPRVHQRGGNPRPPWWSPSSAQQRSRRGAHSQQPSVPAPAGRRGGVAAAGTSQAAGAGIAPRVPAREPRRCSFRQARRRQRRGDPPGGAWVRTREEHLEPPLSRAQVKRPSPCGRDLGLQMSWRCGEAPRDRVRPGKFSGKSGCGNPSPSKAGSGAPNPGPALGGSNSSCIGRGRRMQLREEGQRRAGRAHQDNPRRTAGHTQARPGSPVLACALGPQPWGIVCNPLQGGDNPGFQASGTALGSILPPFLISRPLPDPGRGAGGRGCGRDAQRARAFLGTSTRKMGDIPMGNSCSLSEVESLLKPGLHSPSPRGCVHVLDL